LLRLLSRRRRFRSTFLGREGWRFSVLIDDGRAILDPLVIDSRESMLEQMRAIEVSLLEEEIHDNEKTKLEIKSPSSMAVDHFLYTVDDPSDINSATQRNTVLAYHATIDQESRRFVLTEKPRRRVDCWICDIVLLACFGHVRPNIVFLNSLLAAFRSQSALQVEIIALRHQLIVLQRTEKPTRGVCFLRSQAFCREQELERRNLMVHGYWKRQWALAVLVILASGGCNKKQFTYQYDYDAFSLVETITVHSDKSIVATAKRISIRPVGGPVITEIEVEETHFAPATEEVIYKGRIVFQCKTNEEFGQRISDQPISGTRLYDVFLQWPYAESKLR
jgi:hypothetical protein